MKTYGEKLGGVTYTDREGAYLIAVRHGERGIEIAAVETPKGCFLPGGGIDLGESHADCIRRECLEEIGCAAEIGEYLGSAETYDRHPKIGYFHPVQHYYAGVIGGTVIAAREQDHVFRWLAADDAERFYLEMQREAVKEYLRLI